MVVWRSREQIPRIVVRNHHSSVGLSLADRISQLVGRGIVTREAETLALSQRGNQFPTLWRPAIVDNGERYVCYRRA